MIKLFDLTVQLCKIKKTQKTEKTTDGLAISVAPDQTPFGSSLDPFVQSIICLTSSLRGQLFKHFTTLLQNTLIFFAEKN